MGLLEGKTVIISGVGEGLGRETALAASREGAAVVLGARTRKTLDAVAQEVEAAGGRAAVAETDITDEAACRRLVETAVTTFGGVDALVNIAALDSVFGGFETAGEFEAWHDTMEVNLFGTLKMTRAALPELRKRGGSVVIVSSQTQHHPSPLAIQAAYSASKSAITGAFRHIAHEVGPDGVRINEVAPGWMWGPPVEGFVRMRSEQLGQSEEETLRQMTAHMPLRRMATDGEVAETVVFFASDRSNGITGQTLLVNAGEVMR